MMTGRLPFQSLFWVILSTAKALPRGPTEVKFCRPKHSKVNLLIQRVLDEVEVFVR